MKPSQPAEPVEIPPDAPLDDLVIMKKIVERDETALATFYDRWMPQVYSLAMNIVRSSVDAEDVVEETFWLVWERASTYDASYVSPLTWLMSIGRARSLDKLRAKRARLGGTLEESAGDIGRAMLVNVSTAALAVEADGAVEREAMLDGVRALQVEQQIPVELAYFGGFKQSEIAELLQLPLNTVKVRARVGMETLRDSVPMLRGRVA